MNPTLAELVARMADDPTVANREAFYRVFVGTRVCFCAPKALTDVRGEYITQEVDQISIPTGKGPDGSPMLVVFGDRTSIALMHPSAAYAEVDARVVLQMALANKGGVIVQCVNAGTPSWAGVAREDVVRLLNSPPLGVSGC